MDIFKIILIAFLGTIFCVVLKETRKDTNAWKIDGTPEEDSYLNITNFQIASDSVLKLAKEKNVTVNTYLAAVMMKAILIMNSI